MIKIIDHFISKSCLKDLQDYYLSQICDWHYNDQLTSNSSLEQLGSVGLVIKLHWNNNFILSQTGILTRFLILAAKDKVEEITKISHSILRARADMTLYNPTNYRHELHTDYDEEHITCIFYLNTSDGNTLLYDRKGEELLAEVEPIENRLLIFDGLLQHTGHSPSNHKSRVLINMNFKKNYDI